MTALCENASLDREKRKAQQSLLYKMMFSIYHIDLNLVYFSYLDHVFGEDHPGNTFGHVCGYKSWCCRRRLLNKLYIRNYGHIVLSPYAIIIDELFIIDSRVTRENGVFLIPIDLQQKGLRFELERGDADGGWIRGSINVFIPPAFMEPQDRLVRTVQILNLCTQKSEESNVERHFEQLRVLYPTTYAVNH